MDTDQDVIDISQVIGLDISNEEAEEVEEPLSLNDQLENFRQQWREELYMRTRTDSSSASDRANMVEQAKQIFMMGSRLEQEGSLMQAIQFYRHAMRLVPEIEHLIRLDFTGNGPRERQASESSVESYDGDLIDPDLDLALQFQDLQVEDNGWCTPNFQQRACHISALPTEVMIHILKWVVSSQLDMWSLENVAKVCRGFYVFARDKELWRIACCRIWGPSTGKVKKYGTWRSMYVERPHIQFAGCYISKTVYFRPGEMNFEQHYQPWHEVGYFRYIRFFSEGKVLMMTSAEEPTQTLSKLISPNTDLPEIMQGVYRIAGDRVTGELKRNNPADTNSSVFRYKRNRNKLNNNKTAMTFHIELEIGNAGKKKGGKLTWISYSVQKQHKTAGTEAVTDFDINKNYPPLVFSRVKSFSSNADSPLSL